MSWLLWALLSAVFAAMTALFAKLGVERIDPTYATFVRTLVITAFARMLLLVTGEYTAPSELPRRAWIFLVLSGLATGASWLCYFRALSLGPVAQVAPVEKLSVVLVAIAGVAFLGEHLSPRGWLGVGLICVGAALVAFRPS